jgi:glycosyltransferase involved in cell wall biosynthesis
MTDVENKAEKLQISACLIVKNEEADLDRCLASLHPYLRQIVVVDTGSTDNTVQIAEKYGATIGHFPWTGDFAAARNQSLKLAEEPWILVIDADECMTPESVPLLERILTLIDILAVEVVVNNLDDNGEGRPMKIVRLFRNMPALRFERAIHETIDMAVMEQCAKLSKTIAESAVTLNHYGYMKEKLQRKSGRNLEIMRRELKKDPDDLYLRTKEVEEMYKFGISEELDEKVEWVFRELQKKPQKEMKYVPFYPLISMMYVEMMIRKRDYQGGIEASDWALAHFKDEAWMMYFKGCCLFKSGSLEEATTQFKKCLELEIKPAYYHIEKGIASWLSLFHLGEIANAQGDELAAKEYWHQADAVMDLHTIQERVFENALRGSDFAAAMEICIRLLQENPGDTWALLSGAKVMKLLRMGDKAQGWLKMLLRLEPDNSEALELMAEIEADS